MSAFVKWCIEGRIKCWSCFRSLQQVGYNNECNRLFLVQRRLGLLFSDIKMYALALAEISLWKYLYLEYRQKSIVHHWFKVQSIKTHSPSLRALFFVQHTSGLYYISLTTQTLLFRSWFITQKTCTVKVTTGLICSFVKFVQVCHLCVYVLEGGRESATRGAQAGMGAQAGENQEWVFPYASTYLVDDCNVKLHV